MIDLELGARLQRVSAAAFISLVATAPALGAEPDSSSLSFQDWTVNCAGAPAAQTKTADKPDVKPAEKSAPTCEMVQSFVEKNSQRLVARLAFGRQPNSPDLKLVVQAPVGIWLPDGATVAVSDKLQAKAQFLRCTPSACFAEVDARKEFLDGAKASEKMTLTFSGGANQPVTLNVSTKGFAAAAAALEKK